MAIVAEIGGARKGELLSWFSSLTIVGTLLGAPVAGYLLRAAGPGQHLGRGDFLSVFLLSGLSGTMALIMGLGLFITKQTRRPQLSETSISSPASKRC
jgi:MFS family permease